MKYPLYTTRPSAGFAMPGDDHIDRVLDIHDLVVQNPASTFFMRVEGDSMIDAGIFSGDVLVIDRSKDPKDGSIVVAAVNGEMVIKRLKIESKGSDPLLMSENDAYDPIVVGEGEEYTIWGVVVGLVRQF